MVYTLCSKSKLPFDQFSLIVRSLHTYMVEDITPFADRNCVHVKLQYQASIKNATAKLGKLAAEINITKLSSFVSETEISLLADLRAKYGFGTTDDCETAKGGKSKPGKRSRYTVSAPAAESDPESLSE